MNADPAQLENLWTDPERRCLRDNLVADLYAGHCRRVGSAIAVNASLVRCLLRNDRAEGFEVFYVPAFFITLQRAGDA